MNDRTIEGLHQGEPRPESAANADGLLSSRQMSILMGIPLDEVSAAFQQARLDTPDGQPFTFTMPRAWVRSGKARTALARTDDMGFAIEILSIIDNQQARWVDRNGAIWTVTGHNDIGIPLMATAGSATSGAQIGLTVQQVVENFNPLREVVRRGGAA